jgi:hypothetical protein
MAPDLEESFDTFVRARGEHFLRVAALLTGSPTEAEDLLQASLVRLYRAWPRLGVPESAPDAYLRKILVPAGAVAVLGGAAALGVTLTATVADAPSALAAVTAAAAKTSTESFQMTSTETQATTIVRSSPVHYRPVQTRITGVFDPRRGLAEETVAGVSPVRIVGGHLYAQRVVGSVFAHGKLWVEGQVPPPPVTPGQNPGLGQ